MKITNVFYLFCPRIVPLYGIDARSRIIFTGPETFNIQNVASRGFLKEGAHFVFYTFVFLTGLAGMYLRRTFWKKDFLFYLVILNFTAVYSFYWPATRLRAPMDFIFMVFSAVFLETVYGRLKRKEHASV